MSRVIKSPHALTTPAGAAPLGAPKELMRQLRTDGEFGDDALTQAQNKGEIIVRTARAEAQSVRDQAYEQGYAAGAASAAERAQELIERLENDIAEIAAEKAELVDSTESDVLKLCVDIAEKLVRHEIKTDPRVVLRTIKSCLRRIKDRNDVCVRVSPQELEEVKAHREELLAATEGVRGLSIVDDRRVCPGGCVVETPSGDLDARIETQTEQTSRKLMETFEDDRRKTGFEPDEVSADNQPD